MKKDNYLDTFENKQKAIQHTIWLNFKFRIAKIKFGVIDFPKGKWSVLEEATSKEMGIPFLDKLPQDHSIIDYNEIRHIKIDHDPLPHLEELTGVFAVMDGELLRFLLHAKIPLEKLIRHELASRGYDENHRWVGFDKATDIWL